MTLARPEALWLMALAAPLTALFLFRIRPRLVRVPCLALWAETLAEERRWGGVRLRETVSWTLLTAGLAALALALAGAEFPDWGRRPAAYAVLVDTSASMNAVEAGGRTRAADAGAFLRELKNRLYYNDTLTVVRSPGDHFAPLLSTPPPAGNLVILSDRSEPAPEPAGARWLKLATDRPNAGLTHAVIGRAPEERWHTARVRARNFGSAAASVKLDWRLNGRPLRSDPLELTPGQERELALTLADLPDGGELTVVLTPPDAYPLDDDAHLQVPPARPASVVVVHGDKPNPFLLEALAILTEGGEIGAAGGFKVAAADFDPASVAPGTILIFDGGTLAAPLPPGRRLLLGTEGALETGAALASPEVVSWNPASPLNRFLDFSPLQVRAARPVRANGHTETLVETEREVIGMARRDAAGALIYLGFRLDESDFALLPAFPIFLRNALRWLAEPPSAPPARFDPVESDIAPKAGGEAAEELLPAKPVPWKNIPHAALLAMAAAALLAVELALRSR